MILTVNKFFHVHKLFSLFVSSLLYVAYTIFESLEIMFYMEIYRSVNRSHKK